MDGELIFKEYIEKMGYRRVPLWNEGKGTSKLWMLLLLTKASRPCPLRLTMGIPRFSRRRRQRASASAICISLSSPLTMLLAMKQMKSTENWREGGGGNLHPDSDTGEREKKKEGRRVMTISVPSLPNSPNCARLFKTKHENICTDSPHARFISCLHA